MMCKKLIFCLIVCLLVSQVSLADYIITSLGTQSVARFTDTGELVWETKTDPNINLNLEQLEQVEISPLDGQVYVAQAGWGDNRVIKKFDFETGAFLGDFTAITPDYRNCDIQWGYDYNQDGTADMWMVSKDGLITVNDGATGTLLGQDNTADVNPNDGAGGRGCTFGPDITGDGIGELFVCKGYNDSNNKINIWDPTTITKVGEIAIAEIRECQGIILGPDVNGDGQQDLWVASQRRNEIRTYDYLTGAELSIEKAGITFRNMLDVDYGPDGTVLMVSRFATTLDPDWISDPNDPGYKSNTEYAGGNVIQYDPASGTATLVIEYYDRIDSVAYVPRPIIPVDPGTENLTHSYTFEDGTANDSVGEAHGTLVGGAEVIDGAMVTTAQDQWMSMPGDVIAMNTYDEVTIEAWYTPTEGANLGWSMLAYFGGNANGLGSNGFFITSARGDDKSRAAISIGDEASPWASESGADGPEYDDGLLHHMASTINATDITLYIDGVLIASTPLSETNSIAGISQELALLAKGGYDGDPEWIGAIHEFSIYNKAMSLAEIMYLAGFRAGPVQIEVENFSFELPGTDKIKGWNGEGSGGTPAVDIPGWSSDIAANDSGVESADWVGRTDGLWTGYLMGTDPSVWNQLDYAIQAGDVITVNVDSKNNWTADAALPAQLEITLFYEADGQRIPAAMQVVELTTDWATYSLELVADDLPDSIGHMLGIELNNVSNATADNNSWIALDNVRVELAE